MSRLETWRHNSYLDVCDVAIQGNSGLRLMRIAVTYWEDIDFGTEDPSTVTYAYNTATS